MIDAFVEMLARARAPAGCANPYTIREAGFDAVDEAPAIRRAQLAAYLRRRRGARLILVAEAPGYQGARFSGIAMTCERTLLGHKAGVPAGAVLERGMEGRRTSDPAAARNRPEREGGFSEPTASIVWRALMGHGLAEETVLWNVFPFHPRKAGAPLTNRTPTRAEVTETLAVIRALLEMFPEARVVSVGNTSRDYLRDMVPGIPAVRHPANGGASAFRAGLGEVAADLA